MCAKEGVPGKLEGPLSLTPQRKRASCLTLMGPLNSFVSCYLRTANNITNDSGFPLRAGGKLDPDLRP